MTVETTKLLATLGSPLGAFVAGVLLYYLLRAFGRRWSSRIVLLVSFAGLWGLSTPLASGWLQGSLERRHVPASVEETPAAEAVVMIGGALGGPKPPWYDINLVSASDRVLHTARLYRAGKAPKVVVSGGSAPGTRENQPESGYVGALLEEWGVPRAAMILEDRSRSTRENALYTAEALAEHGIGRVLLVTSAMHMHRAWAAFRREGIDAIPAPTDFETVTNRFSDPWAWLPTADALEKSSRSVREYLAILYYQSRGWM